MNTFARIVLSLSAVTLACGCSAPTEGEGDGAETASSELTIGSGEFFPAPHASLSLSGLSPSSVRSGTFSYNPAGASVASDKYRAIILSGASSGKSLEIAIDSTSTSSDPVAVLTNSGFQSLASDDDSGGGRNALIKYAVPAGTGSPLYLMVKEYGRGAGSFRVTVRDATQGSGGGGVPTAPTSVSAKSTGTSARLTWEVPYATTFPMVMTCTAEDTHTSRLYTWSLSYNIDYRADQRLTGKDIANLASGDHAFRVQCRNVNGFGPWSYESNTVTVTIGGGGYGVPAAPSAVSIIGFQPAVGTVPNHLRVRFTPGAAGDSYIQECEAQDTETSRNYSFTGSFYSGSSTLVQARDVQSGSHAFKVRCRNTRGWGAWSDTSPSFEVTVLAVPQAPSAPDATYYSFYPGQVTLDFDVSDYWSSSITECKTQDTVTQNITTLSGVSSSNYLRISATPGTHRYKIACKNSNGWGPWSGQSSMVTVQ
jgi:hypothetical protein